MATGETGLDIDLLIGADQYHSIVLGQTIPSDTGRGPTAATLTRLGYTLSGPTDLPANFSYVNTSLNVTHFMQIKSSPMKTKPIEEFYENCLWDYETLGIKPAEPPIYEPFLETIDFVDGRYEISLPFKEDHETIPDNYSLSLQRCQSLIKRLRSKPEIMAE